MQFLGPGKGSRTWDFRDLGWHVRASLHLGWQAQIELSFWLSWLSGLESMRSQAYGSERHGTKGPRPEALVGGSGGQEA